jgi:hypothetical protein
MLKLPLYPCLRLPKEFPKIMHIPILIHLFQKHLCLGWETHEGAGGCGGSHVSCRSADITTISRHQTIHWESEEVTYIPLSRTRPSGHQPRCCLLGGQWATCRQIRLCYKNYSCFIFARDGQYIVSVNLPFDLSPAYRSTANCQVLELWFRWIGSTDQEGYSPNHKNELQCKDVHCFITKLGRVG